MAWNAVCIQTEPDRTLFTDTDLFCRWLTYKYFIHIIYTFLLFALIIWVSLMVETTMAKVESQKAQIRELKIINSQKVYELAETTRRSEVDKRLESLGSQVGEIEERAVQLN